MVSMAVFLRGSLAGLSYTICRAAAQWRSDRNKAARRLGLKRG
jgi:hypothetical protein